MLALDEVRQRGCREAIILGQRGEVAEGATSNVFAVREGALQTPPISAGILEGITRRAVLELAAARGIAYSERELWPEALYGADEVFITSSIREILPVVSVEGRSIGDGRPGPICRGLHAAYRELAAREAAS